MTDQINDARQNLRLPQERKDAYARDAHSMGLTLPEYTRLALAAQLKRTPAKILELLKAMTATPELLAACKATVAMFSVKPGSTLPQDIQDDMTKLFRRDPVCQQLIAAIAKAETNK